MAETYALVLEGSPSSEDVDTVTLGLGRFNREVGGIVNFKELALFIRNTAGQTVGGLLGYSLGTRLHVETLWLDETIRRMGHGTRLLQRAGEEALARGCRVVDLSTFDFQAPRFYEKRGYVAFGELKEVGGAHNLYFFRKYLDRHCHEA